MKPLAILLLATLSTIAGADDSKESEVHGAWMKLSADAQNVAWAFRQLSPTGRPDPSWFSDELKSIDAQLDLLLKAGELADAKIALKSLKDMGEDGFAEVQSFVDMISKTYGHYVAVELVDLGLRRQLSFTDETKPLVLHLRLPPKRLEEFRDLVKEHKLLAKKEAEQDGAEQPATAPESKPEDQKKPKRESEARS